MIDSIISLFIVGTIYFAIFIVGGYAFLMCLLLIIRFFKRLAYGENKSND